MIVQNLYHGKLSISEEGVIALEDGWILSCSEWESKEEFLDSARAWAGNIGDPFRIPEPEGEFHFAEFARVSSIDIKQLKPGRCEVTFKGEDFGEEPIIPTGAVEDQFRSDGSHTRKRSFRAAADIGEELIPRAGQLLDWAGGSFGCESCDVARYDTHIEFTVSAREISRLELDSPVHGRDSDGFATLETQFFVNSATCAGFREEHIPGNAAAWAGENFILESISEKAHGKIGYIFTLLARKVETRRLSTERSEEFAGFNRAGGVRRTITWTARWRALTADVPHFYLLSGTPVADWAEPNCIVTGVRPNRLSDFEYEVEVVAQHKRNPGLIRYYEEDDREDLGDRSDVSVDMGDFFLTAEMAGYQKMPDGRFMPIPEWSPSQSCPLTADSRLSPNLIESTLKCLVVTESVYRKGGAAKQIADFQAWAVTKVASASVGGASGSFLKLRQTCHELRDSEGELYTRITRTYQRAPNSMAWNGTYWLNH